MSSTEGRLIRVGRDGAERSCYRVVDNRLHSSPTTFPLGTSPPPPPLAGCLREQM